MRKLRWSLAAPLLLVMASVAAASEIRDDAGMFAGDAMRQAETALQKVQRDTKVPIVIETITSLRGEDAADAAKRRAMQAGERGVFVLLAKKEKKISVVVAPEYARVFPSERRVAIHDAFKKEFDKSGLDRGLVAAIQDIGAIATDAMKQSGGPSKRAVAPPARAGAPPARVGQAPGVPQQRRGGGGLVSGLIAVGLIILVILIAVRVLGALFRGVSGGYGGPAQMGGPGYGPGQGYGPGPGYAGRGGGGFWSSMFGGIGGAVAGNWLYDQFSGRNHHTEGHQPTSGNLGDGGYYGGAGSAPQTGGDEWVGGESTNWGDSGGGGGGGDWVGGGGDGGGGGDWGGGGGGGGDWGGGGGGDGGGWS
jgi:hypothetical protein